MAQEPDAAEMQSQGGPCLRALLQEPGMKQGVSVGSHRETMGSECDQQ